MVAKLHDAVLEHKRIRIWQAIFSRRLINLISNFFVQSAGFIFLIMGAVMTEESLIAKAE